MKRYLKEFLLKKETDTNLSKKTGKKNKDPRNRKWFRLDNSAKLYPVIMKKSYVSVFRVSAEIKDEINYKTLQKALDLIIDRFPYYKVRLRRGFFWYYFEKNNHKLNVEKDVQYPCEYMKRKENNGYLVKVRYYNKRIAVEFFHGLTDGAGAVIFLKTLIAQYIKLEYNESIPYEKGVFNPNELPEIEEFEDSYNKYAEFKVVKRPNRENAYKIKGTNEFGHIFHIITGIVPLNQLKTKSKEYKVSITEYLVSVLIKAIYEYQKQDSVMKRNKPIQISVPVNMRNIYPSKTMRNFSLFTSPGIEPAYGEYSFDEILHNVHHYMRFQLNSKYMNALMCANVSSEKKTLLKIAPLFLKNIGMMIGYKKFGILKFTSTFSNLGIIDLPLEMKDYVNRFDIIVGPCTYNPINIGLLSYGDKLHITMSDTIIEKQIQQTFFTHLVKDGIQVKIETNERW